MLGFSFSLSFGGGATVDGNKVGRSEEQGGGGAGMSGQRERVVIWRGGDVEGGVVTWRCGWERSRQKERGSGHERMDEQVWLRAAGEESPMREREDQKTKGWTRRCGCVMRTMRVVERVGARAKRYRAPGPV